MIVALYSLLAFILSTISSRFVFGGDSAEFSAIAHNWSGAHPPGYPLYTLILNCITHIIPFGTIPWRGSLLSIVPMVLSSFLLFKIMQRLKIRVPIALVSSLLFIFLFPVWEYTLVTEVFGLNTFLVIAVTYCLLLYQESKQIKHLFLAAFLVGLCIAHHHIFVIFVPGWFLLVQKDLKKLSKKVYMFTALLLLLGSLFYLYMPISSSFNPPMQWEDSKTLGGFWRLITRAQYGSFTAYGGSKGNFFNQLYDVFSMIVLVFQDFRIMGVVGIIAGMVASFKRKNIFFRFLLVTTLIHVFFLFYTNFMLSNSFSIGLYERFLISFYVILVIYLGVGFNALYSQLQIRVGRLSNTKTIITFSRICALLCILIYIGTIIKTNFRAISTIRDGTDFDRLGKDIINTVPPGGIYFVNGDNSFFSTLYQLLESKYPTKSIFFRLNFINRKYYVDRFKKENPTLIYPSKFENNDNFMEFAKLNKNRGLYLDTAGASGFWMPYGILWKFYSNQDEAVADLPNLVTENSKLWEKVYHIPELNIYTRNIMHLQSIQETYVQSYLTYARLLSLANEQDKARIVMRGVINKYKPTNPSAKITLVNLLLLDKNCAQATPIVKELSALSLDQLSGEQTASLIHYYDVCDPHNSMLQQLKKNSEKDATKSLTPLSAF